KKARELEVQVMETRKRVLRAEHPNTLSIMDNLVWIYGYRKRWVWEMLEMRRRILWAKYLDTLSSMANLALTYRN
ncbi:uncharacterized protein K441DRAFT_573662, partial [Cenococcum geophilum 1.58]|uniref:uncharacterized protein n=1 Tax=Cenococcum geophilum 1.58 TaxID=794803 RepID=UPI00358DE7DC